MRGMDVPIEVIVSRSSNEEVTIEPEHRNEHPEAVLWQLVLSMAVQHAQPVPALEDFAYGLTDILVVFGR